jgi:hypothetical protein
LVVGDECVGTDFCEQPATGVAGEGLLTTGENYCVRTVGKAAWIWLATALGVSLPAYSS